MSDNLYSLVFLLFITIGSIINYVVLYFLSAVYSNYNDAFIYAGIIGAFILAIFKIYRLLSAYIAGHIIAIVSVNWFDLSSLGTPFRISLLLIIILIIVGVFLEYYRQLIQK